MPHFSFYRLLDDDSRFKLASEELPDGEAARDLGIGLAEDLLRDQAADDSPAKSRIVIFDDERGEDMDHIVSERF